MTNNGLPLTSRFYLDARWRVIASLWLLSFPWSTINVMASIGHSGLNLYRDVLSLSGFTLMLEELLNFMQHLWVASSILSISLFPLCHRYSDISCSLDGQEDPGGEIIGLVIWNSLPLSVRHSSSLSSFKSELKTHLSSFAYWSVVFFLLILLTHHQ